VRFRRLDLRPDPVSKIPVAELRDYVRTSYRLVPDRRVLFAIGEVQRLSSGKPAPEVTLDFENERWSIRCGARLVGSLPMYPSFSESLVLLTSWAKQSAADLGAVKGSRGKALSRAESRVAEFFAPALLDLLIDVDHAWGPSSRSVETIETAARALVFLKLQTFDRLDMADPLSARALAIMALAKAAGSQKLQREEVLLAETMGYEADARALAAELALDDPVRSFVLRQEKALLAAADLPSADRLAQYLAALRLAENGDVAVWSAWILKHPALYKQLVAPPLLGAALRADEFAYSRLLPGAMRTACLWALLPPAEKRDLDLGEGVSPDGEGSSEIAGFSAAVWKKFGLDEGKMLRRFERELDARGAQARGPIVDALLIRSYYGAGYFSALYETGRFLLDRFSSEPAAREFAASLGQPTSPAARDLKRWIEDRGDIRASRKPGALLLTDIGEIRNIGLVPVSRMRRSADEYLSTQIVERRRMGRDLFARMDARPAFLAEAARVAYDEVHDIRLRDRLLEAAAARAPREASEQLPWLAALGAGSSVLKEIGDREDLKPETRSRALKMLAESTPAEQDYVGRRLRELVTSYPDRSSIIDDEAWLEERRGGPADASRALKAWLQLNSSKQDLDWIHVATSLSKMLQKEGKLEESWQVIAPLVDSGKSETLAQGAIVLEALGKHAEARDLAQNNLDRYPTSGFATADLAEILWRQHDDAGAADLLKRNDKILTRSEWYWAVAVGFAKAFATAPAGAAEKAFDQIAARGFDADKLLTFVGPLAEKGRHDVAVVLSQKARPLPKQTIYDWLRTYREMKKLKGSAEATDWLKKMISPQAAETASTAFYYEGEYDLLWDMVPSVPNRTKNNMLQLFRVAALVRTRAGEADPRRRELLRESEESSQRDMFVNYARYLLGLDDQEKLLASAIAPSQACDVAYLIGIKNVSERKYDEAMDWFQAALETGETHSPLYNSTFALISGWTRTEKSFARIAAEGL
jgi:hypothetical protein